MFSHLFALFLSLTLAFTAGAAPKKPRRAKKSARAEGAKSVCGNLLKSILIPTHYEWSNYDIAAAQRSLIIWFQSASQAESIGVEVASLTRGEDMDVVVEVNPEASDIPRDLFTAITERLQNLADQDLGILDPGIEEQRDERRDIHAKIRQLEKVIEQLKNGLSLSASEFEQIREKSGAGRQAFPSQAESQAMAARWITAHNEDIATLRRRLDDMGEAPDSQSIVTIQTLEMDPDARRASLRIRFTKPLTLFFGKHSFDAETAKSETARLAYLVVRTELNALLFRSFGLRDPGERASW